MELYEKEILTRNLKKMTTSSLCEIAGNEVVEMLDQSGVSITPSNVINVILETQGYSLFMNKIVRNHFAAKAQLNNISSWSNNSSSKKLLESYGLSEGFLPQPQSRRAISLQSVPGFILHNYQDDIKKKTSKFLLGVDTKLMIQLPTGAGKTSMTIESIIDFYRLSEQKNPCVVWMAHTDELCEQAIEAFNRAWKDKGTFAVELIRLWGGNASDYKPKESPSFIVTSFQSAYSMIRTRNDDVFAAFNHISGKTNLLVVDEAHMSLARTYKSAIELFSNKHTKLIGLTATPGRHSIEGNNEETIELANFYNNNIINMNHFCGDQTPVQYLQSQGILSKVEVRKLITNYTHDLTPQELESLQVTGNLSDRAIKEVSKDVERNSLIFKQIKNVCKLRKKKTLVFASSVENSNSLAAMLVHQGVLAKSVTGDTNPSDRMKAVKDFNDGKLEVLINFNIFSTGFDDPLIDCVIIARPTFSVVLYSQMVGRGLRGVKNGGTENCLLVNVIDNIVNLPDIENACNFFDKEWGN